MGRAPSVIAIVGHSGAGKTTLVEKLICELTARGMRVATIKHAHHKVELDTPGKDSYRYKEAGAVMSMLLTRDALQLVADAKEAREPGQLAAALSGRGGHGAGGRFLTVRHAQDRSAAARVR